MEDPFNAPNVKALVGQEGYRLRVGRYRVLYLVDSGELLILVVKIADRKDAYR